MLPESWNQAGDGVTFIIDLHASDQISEIYSQHLNPKQYPQDRIWYDAQVDLTAYAGKLISLILRTDGGEAGDLQFDWACWGEPVIDIR
jgi:hypothetical protein